MRPVIQTPDVALLKIALLSRDYTSVILYWYRLSLKGLHKCDAPVPSVGVTQV